MAEPIPPLNAPPPPETPLDAGSQALSEALRSSFTIVKIVMGILLLVFLCSGFFIVEQQERVIVLRFGKPQGRGQTALLGPGLHWSFPYPIDERVRVSVIGIQQVKSTIGWFLTTPVLESQNKEPESGPTLNPAVDGYVITADNNIIHSRATLNYHISDPLRYVFDFQSASNAVQNALDNTLLYTAAHFGMDDILTNRLGFQVAVRKRTAELVSAQDLGIVIDQCSVEAVRPRQCKEAFQKVNTAQSAYTTAINDARRDATKDLSKAAADASSLTNAAAVAAQTLVNDAQAQTELFQRMLPLYTENPSLLERRRLETLANVFTNADYKIFVTVSPDGRQQMRFLFNKEQVKKLD